METIVVICIGIMCWLFCTFYFFCCLEEDDDTVYATISCFILAMIIGWIVTPIILGINYAQNILFSTLVKSIEKDLKNSYLKREDVSASIFLFFSNIE